MASENFFPNITGYKIDDILYICIKYRQLLYKNLIYLRKKYQLSQDKIASGLSITRTTWAGYEKGKCEPTASVLKRISTYFQISVDSLLFENLENPTNKMNQLDSLMSHEIRVLAITVNEKQKENVELVPVQAIAGYAQNFTDINFVGSLPKLSIPKLREGTYRAFEVKGLSMLPINEGSIVIGKFVTSFHEFQNNKRYILVIRDLGVTFKKVVSDSKSTDRVILVSDNTEYLPFSIAIMDILEMWEMVAYIGFGNNVMDYNTLLMQKIDNIEQHMSQIIKT